MKVHVEWLDGVKRTYEDVGRADPGRDQVLRLYSREVYGLRELIASLPTASIREWRTEDDR